MYYLPVREILARLLSSHGEVDRSGLWTRRSWKEQKVTNVFFFFFFCGSSFWTRWRTLDIIVVLQDDGSCLCLINAIIHHPNRMDTVQQVSDHQLYPRLGPALLTAVDRFFSIDTDLWYCFSIIMWLYDLTDMPLWPHRYVFRMISEADALFLKCFKEDAVPLVSKMTKTHPPLLTCQPSVHIP